MVKVPDRKNSEEIAHVREDESGKLVRFIVLYSHRMKYVVWEITYVRHRIRACERHLLYVAYQFLTTFPKTLVKGRDAFRGLHADLT